MSKVIVADEERCLACKTCVIECSLAHTQAETLVQAMISQIRMQPRLFVEAAGEFGMPLQCRHCEDAPCMMVCPTEAIHRFDASGPVLIDQDRCIGCRFCSIVCPFGVVDISHSGKAMIKCDLCIERTEVGEEPACVSSCPTKALKFVEMEEWIADRRRSMVERIAEGRQRANKVVEELPHGC